MSQWYYAKGGQQLGPVDDTQLRQLLAQGALAGGDLVWREGMSQWEPAIAVMPDAVPQQMLTPLGSMPVPAAGGPAVIGYYNQMQSGPPPYAGFWWRVLAAFIDGIFLAVVGYAVNIPIYLAFGLPWHGTPPTVQHGTTPPTSWMIAAAVVWVLGVIIGWLYEAIFTCSKHQGTLGKIACGLRVARLDGSPISFARASGRHFAKVLSALTLAIGYLMVAFTQKKQGLHDLICDTCVLKKQP